MHPTQLYTSAIALVGVAALLALGRSERRAGTIFFAFLTWWGVSRLLIDTLRFYPPSVFVDVGPGLSVAKHQPIVAALAAAGVAGLVWLARRSGGEEGTGAA